MSKTTAQLSSNYIRNKAGQLHICLPTYLSTANELVIATSNKE